MHRIFCVTSETYLPWLLFLLQTVFVIVPCVQFDKSHFGVTFQPWVQLFADGENAQSQRFHTNETIKTMLNIVAERFGRTFLPDQLARHETYTFPDTYYNGSSFCTYTGEMAAEINRENNNKTLTVIYNVLSSRSPNKTRVGNMLAFEAAERANKIFPGTVEGISFGDPVAELPKLRIVLEQLQFHRQNALQAGIKLGASLDCIALVNQLNNTFSYIQQAIVKASDFIACKVYAGHHAKDGPVAAFERISKIYLASRDAIKQINSNAELFGRSEWSSSGLKEWETVETLMTYWKSASEWSRENNFTVFMSETFDAPWRAKLSRRHGGWWKLKFDDITGMIVGHSEKIAEIEKETVQTAPPPTTATAGAWNEVTTSLSVIVGLILITALAYFAFSRSNQSADLTRKEIQNFMLGTSIPTVENGGPPTDPSAGAPYDSSLEIKKDALKIDKTRILGKGQFGLVFQAVISTGTCEVVDVALKIANENCGASALKGLLSEIKVMSYLGSHPNIVDLIGAYTAELSRGVVYVATELCELGSLQNFLRKNQWVEEKRTAEYQNLKSDIELATAPANLSGLDMIRWSHEIACGMEHLEKKHVVHADLATRNVLLSADKIARIADFGLSRRMYNYMTYVKKQKDPLPWRWMAVESLKQLEFSSKSDVWSYGVTLWEVFSRGDTPYPAHQWTEEFVEELVNGLRPKQPPFATPEIYRIMRECWKLNPNDRPDFSQLSRWTEQQLHRCQGNFVDDNPYRIQD